MQNVDYRRILAVAGIAALFNHCTEKKNFASMQPVQLTSGRYGHMLNSTQVFSPDDQWVVYDTRNDQTHIARTCCIEKVNVNTGEILKLYRVPNQTVYGPGVGAVSYHPVENKLIFIHGLLNCDESKPYSFTRRFGALLDESAPQRISHAEARRIDAPFVPGALRGGTHAHSWNGDGTWLSFTYNDVLMEQQETETNGAVKDLRTIGVMTAPGVKIQTESAENFSGKYFSAVAASVSEKPTPGSDEIEKAFDECWIGNDGYLKKDGTRQKRAIAFQGNVRSTNGSLLTEIFVSDIPEDITIPLQGRPLSGTRTTRPAVPQGVVQRRVTFTSDRKFPGVQGVRFWVRSSGDGAFLYFLMKDDQGIVQVYEVPTLGGEVRQVTQLAHSIQTQFSVSPDAKMLALIADNSVWLTDIKTGQTRRITSKASEAQAPAGAVLWNHAANMLVYNSYVGMGDDRYLQIFKISLN